MSSEVRKPESVDVVLVEFGYYNTTVEDSTNPSGRHQVFFWLPGMLLWSSEGLAQMFEITRVAWLDTDDGFHDEEEWQTWHLIKIHDDVDIDHQIVLNVDWSKTVPKRAAGEK